MGNTIMTQRHINFEDMQLAINEMHNQYAIKSVIINTLDAHNQNCLIVGTLNIENEVDTLNMYMKQNKEVRIIVYGMNAADGSCLKKYEQLIKLGFYNVYIYAGGLFEWLLLQDIYGAELFPTTATKVDILKYKGRKQMNMKLLNN
jgi:hypothetical protein